MLSLACEEHQCAVKKEKVTSSKNDNCIKLKELFPLIRKCFYKISYGSYCIGTSVFGGIAQTQISSPVITKYIKNYQCIYRKMTLYCRDINGSVWWVNVVVWGRWAYRDEVSSPAVDVNAVIIHTDHFIGLCYKESCTAELRTLRCEGELTLHCNHVQATWETITHGCICTRTNVNIIDNKKTACIRGSFSALIPFYLLPLFFFSILRISKFTFSQ